MDNQLYVEIGKRIKVLRKMRGLNQTELAARLQKSLRTLQKYEMGEIEVSIAIIHQIAGILETTPTYLLGYETDTPPIRNLANVMDFFFKFETVKGIDFQLEVRRPPKFAQWECLLTFDGKNKSADFNADMCLFLEEWRDRREDVRTYACSQSNYQEWQEKTRSYYSAVSVECEEPEELDPDVRMQKRKEFMTEWMENTTKK